MVGPGEGAQTRASPCDLVPQGLALNHDPVSTLAPTLPSLVADDLLISDLNRIELCFRAGGGASGRNRVGEVVPRCPRRLSCPPCPPPTPSSDGQTAHVVFLPLNHNTRRQQYDPLKRTHQRQRPPSPSCADPARRPSCVQVRGLCPSVPFRLPLRFRNSSSSGEHDRQSFPVPTLTLGFLLQIESAPTEGGRGKSNW